MSVLDGPGEGTWSVFAMKVAEERDAAREALANSDACWRMEQEFLQRKLDEARAEVEMLRERLEVERTPNGAGKWNAERVLREKAERERDEARADFDSLEDDAAKVVLAYRNGDKIELDEAVESLVSNGRPQWWEKSKPIGLRGESDDQD